jgi:hypothetical protein
MKEKLFFVLTALALWDCKAVENNNTALRIHNGNDFNIDSVYVVAATDAHQYETVPANESSDYHMFDEIYRYAYIRAVVNEKEYIWEPVDYVRETPLSSANYTYRLVIDTKQETYSGIGLMLIKD